MNTPRSDVVDDSLPVRSDEELVDAARAGDDAAYAELWERHVASGRNAARAVSPTVDPDDLVSEAFTLILSAIRKGGGPHEGFRPYLFSTIRNIAASWGRRAKEIPLDDLDERAAESSAEFAELVADRSVLAQAFRELPERWRELLWYTEVEGMKPREVAPLLGMTPNAVSALAYRAREGFKQSWLQAHISDPARPAECRWVCELLVASDRKPVRRGDRRRLDAHLRECQACRIVAADLENVSQKLRMVLLPLVLGGVGALAYTTDATPAVAAVVTGTPVRGGGTSGSGGTGASGGASGGGAGAGGAGTTVLSAVGIAAGAVAAAAAVAVVITLAPWNAPLGETDAAPIVSDASSGQHSPPTSDGTDADEAPTTPDVPTVPEPVAPPVVEAAPAPAPPAPVPAPAPAPVPAPAPPPPPPTPAPNPTPTPTPPVEPARTAAPALAPVPNLDAPVPDPITGTGVPGATAVLNDELGTTLAETTVQPDGVFIADIPADLLREGMTVRAVQTAPGLLTSEPSAATGPFTLPAPSVTTAEGTAQTFLEDADGDGAADDLALFLDGQQGWLAVVSFDGTSTGNRHELTGTPLRRVVYNTAPGDHVVGVRYVDPETDRVGRLATFTITALAPVEPVA